jgi:type IV secretion system T-DNA border endonuclease VirD2
VGARFFEGEHTGQGAAVNIVLSMPAGTDPQAVLAASRGFAKEQLGDNHQYLLALHTDTPQPHVHLAVKAQGFDLTWLKRSKADLQEWRERFAQKMRDQGVEAEATPRRARGVIRKAKTQAMSHLVKEPKRSKVMKAKVDDAIREIDGQKPTRDQSWGRAIVERQRTVRSVYQAIAKELRDDGDALARDMGAQVASFLSSLPPIETEHAVLKRQLAAMMSIERTSERTPAQQQGISTPGAPVDGSVRGRDVRAR